MAKRYAVNTQIRLVNGFVKMLNRLGLAGGETYTLTTVGRKSGEARQTPITLATVDRTRYLVAPYGAVGWVYNVRASGTAELTRKGTTKTVTVTEVDANEAGPVLKQYFDDLKIVRPYFEAVEGAGVEAFIAEADRHPVFRLGK